MAARDNNWHLDKRVSLATIAALIIQFVMLFGSGVWFVSQFRARSVMMSVVYPVCRTPPPAVFIGGL